MIHLNFFFFSLFFSIFSWRNSRVFPPTIRRNNCPYTRDRRGWGCGRGLSHFGSNSLCPHHPFGQNRQYNTPALPSNNFDQSDSCQCCRASPAKNSDKKLDSELIVEQIFLLPCQFQMAVCFEKTVTFKLVESKRIKRQFNKEKTSQEKCHKRVNLDWT